MKHFLHIIVILLTIGDELLLNWIVGQLSSMDMFIMGGDRWPLVFAIVCFS